MSQIRKADVIELKRQARPVACGTCGDGGDLDLADSELGWSSITMA